MTGDRMLENPVSALKKEKGERIPELSRIGPFCVFLSLPQKDRRAPVSILVGSNMERCLLSLKSSSSSVTVQISFVLVKDADSIFSPLYQA